MLVSCESLQLGLEDLLGDLQFARKRGDLGRLALLAYCEVRRWARMAGEQALAEQSANLINNSPHASRDAFIVEVDHLISGLEQTRIRISGSAQSARAADTVVGWPAPSRIGVPIVAAHAVQVPSDRAATIGHARLGESGRSSRRLRFTPDPGPANAD